MKILKVIVDRKPDSCEKCIKYVGDSNRTMNICIFQNKSLKTHELLYNSCPCVESHPDPIDKIIADVMALEVEQKQIEHVNPHNGEEVSRTYYLIKGTGEWRPSVNFCVDGEVKKRVLELTKEKLSKLLQ